jgi:translocation and assembly module TamB
VAGTASRQAQIAWQPVTGAPGVLRSAGRLEGLPLAWMEALAGTRLVDSGVSSDLVFDGDWDVAMAEQLRVRASLQRRSGDITLLADDAVAPASNGAPAGSVAPAARGTRIAAGVREARLSIASDGPAVVASLRWDSAQAGQADARVSTRLTQQNGQWTWPAQAPLEGRLKASLPRISTWSVLAPPGWRAAGTLEAEATLAGTRAAPQMNGTLQARGLALRSVVNGISLSDGTLLARLQGNRMRIESFTLKGAGGGSVTAQGEVAWVDGKPGMTIDAVAQELRVTTQPDRRVTVSGNLKARLANAQMNLDGQLKVDQARIMLPEESAPQLGDDVFVRKPVPPGKTGEQAGPAGPAAQPIKLQLNVTLDLGNDFRLTGLGIDTRLAGKLQLTGDGKTPRLLGTINTVDGEYRAYGQWLTIEQGVLRFTGPYDNPSLDVLAIRPNLTQRVGVQITGTALAPTVRLYASPDMADSEKLAWLLLGRSSASGGAEAAMLQQAAVALIGGSKSGGGIASRFGLDELSLGGSATSDGASTSKTSAVTLGKRLSRNFYVAYEASLSGAMGTLFVFYDLSQRFTLRGQSGQESAVDLIFTLRYD